MSEQFPQQRQITMTEVVAGKTVASAERIKICEDWVCTCTAVNMPLSKSDHPSMRQFLKEKVIINGGAIPGYHQLQEKYLGDEVKKELKQHLAGKPVAVIFDETPDVDTSGRMIAYLAETVFLEQCNHSTVSMAVVKCLQDYNISNDDVIAFDTDKAALQSLFPNSLHITCMAHIMNLIGSAFRKPFDQLNAFMLSFSQVFYQAGACKRRYLTFLTTKLAGRKRATMAPNICVWPKCTIIQLNIMADKCKVILLLLDISQSRRPVTTKIFHYLEDLQMNIAANKDLQYEACSHYFDAVDNLPFSVKTKILSTVEEAYSKAEEKLTK
ncbi:unnamed protein product [Coregonus sp. 'balchen']|nr:unnamed protein product [Coregonus sp. 'balchen']